MPGIEGRVVGVGNPVAAHRLGVVHRAVGAVQQPGCVLRIAQRGNPGADGHRDALAKVANLELADRRANTLGQQVRAVEIGVAQHHHELLAPVAKQQVAVAHAAPETVGERLQHRVAGGVAEAVVDRFELVGVDHHQR